MPSDQVTSGVGNCVASLAQPALDQPASTSQAVSQPLALARQNTADTNTKKSEPESDSSSQGPGVKLHPVRWGSVDAKSFQRPHVTPAARELSVLSSPSSTSL